MGVCSLGIFWKNPRSQPKGHQIWKLLYYGLPNQSDHLYQGTLEGLEAKRLPTQEIPPGFIHHQHRLQCKMQSCLNSRRPWQKTCKIYIIPQFVSCLLMNEVGSYPQPPTPSTGCYVASLPWYSSWTHLTRLFWFPKTAKVLENHHGLLLRGVGLTTHQQPYLSHQT